MLLPNFRDYLLKNDRFKSWPVTRYSECGWISSLTRDMTGWGSCSDVPGGNKFVDPLIWHGIVSQFDMFICLIFTFRKLNSCILEGFRQQLYFYFICRVCSTDFLCMFVNCLSSYPLRTLRHLRINTEFYEVKNLSFREKINLYPRILVCAYYNYNTRRIECLDRYVV